MVKAGKEGLQGGGYVDSCEQKGKKGGRFEVIVGKSVIVDTCSKNLREALDGALNGRRGQLKQAAAALNPHRQAISAGPISIC